MQNYPNPFCSQTTIIYTLPDARYQMPDARLKTQDAGHMTLTVYDIAGRLVRILVDQPSIHPSIHPSDYVVWDGRDDAGTPVAGGIYFYRLSARGLGSSHEQLTATGKMVLVR